MGKGSKKQQAGKTSKKEKVKPAPAAKAANKTADAKSVASSTSSGSKKGSINKFVLLRKTELCTAWKEGKCDRPVGMCVVAGCDSVRLMTVNTEECAFAHGVEDLRNVSVKRRARLGLLPSASKYRTQPCVSFIMTGECRYGIRCAFVHDPRVSSDPLARVKARDWCASTEEEKDTNEDVLDDPTSAHQCFVPNSELDPQSPTYVMDKLERDMWTMFLDTMNFLDDCDVKKKQKQQQLQLRHDTGAPAAAGHACAEPSVVAPDAVSQLSLEIDLGPIGREYSVEAPSPIAGLPSPTSYAVAPKSRIVSTNDPIRRVGVSYAQAVHTILY